MARWLRIFLCIFAFAGLLAATPGQAFAAKASHARAAHHECCPGMAGAHRGTGHDHASLPDCCVIGVCACVVAAAEPSRDAETRPATYSLADVVIPHDEARPASLSRPPVLRPPIA